MNHRANFIVFVIIVLLGWGGSFLYYKQITVTFRDAITQKAISTAILETNNDRTQQADATTGAFTAGFTANPMFAQSTLPLKVLAPGYRPGSLNLIIPREQLNPQVEIYLEPTLITGRVIDGLSHEPLSGVTLQAGLASQPQITQTDKMGTFQFYRLWVNDHIAIQTPRGYQPTSGLTLGDMADLSKSLEFMLIPTVITGQVISQATGEPLAGVQLGAGFGAYQQTITTDEQGYFTFYRLVPEDVITVKSPEYAPFEQPVGLGQPLKLPLQLLN